MLCMSKIIKLELTTTEYDLLCSSLDKAYEELSTMTPEQRQEWYENALFDKSVNFQKEIDGTVYSVRTHFNSQSKESIKQKIVRILELNDTNNNNHALKC